METQAQNQAAYTIEQGSIACIMRVNGDPIVYFAAGEIGLHEANDAAWQALPRVVQYIIAERFARVFAVEGMERGQRVEEYRAKPVHVYAHQLQDDSAVPDETLASDFDYIDLPSACFFKHADTWHHLDDFAVLGSAGSAAGVAAYSFNAFSSLLVSIADDGETVHAALINQ